MKMNYLFKVLGIKMKTVGPYNNKSLQTECGIKSLSNMLKKHLTSQGQTWHKFWSLATRVLLSLETDPDMKGFSYINEIYHIPNILNEQ